MARGSSKPLEYVDNYRKSVVKSVFPKKFLFVYLLAKIKMEKGKKNFF